ncbi:MAG: hypothetical protein M3437_03900 [Chloroflexota bacterium]|nr:hypothetical protein [Chloroflexota bacterium]MDQ5864500.1 hypothetical protein [Chloroflexota bacterium]
MNDQAALTVEELAIACRLSEAEQAAREEELARDIFSNCQEVAELADGYAFRFAGEGEWAAKLLEFIALERKCCPFFTFELAFEPQEGPIWLRLRGPEGVKTFIEQSFITTGGQAVAT